MLRFLRLEAATNTCKIGGCLSAAVVMCLFQQAGILVVTGGTGADDELGRRIRPGLGELVVLAVGLERLALLRGQLRTSSQARLVARPSVLAF